MKSVIKFVVKIVFGLFFLMLSTEVMAVPHVRIYNMTSIDLIVNYGISLEDYSTGQRDYREQTTRVPAITKANYVDVQVPFQNGSVTISLITVQNTSGRVIGQDYCTEEAGYSCSISAYNVSPRPASSVIVLDTIDNMVIAAFYHGNT